jgi:hypothetical protein
MPLLESTINHNLWLILLISGFITHVCYKVKFNTAFKLDYGLKFVAI